MQNKQLQRELKGIIQNLKGPDVLNVMNHFQSYEKQFKNMIIKQYQKSGINCTKCVLKYDLFEATGFGRNQQESLINATRNLMQTLIAGNVKIETLKLSLKQGQHENKTNLLENQKQNITDGNKILNRVVIRRDENTKSLKKMNLIEESLNLDVENDLKDISDLSQIEKIEQILQKEQKRNIQEGCSCVYYEIHTHHMNEIKNLQARMKLIAKQNEMLKQLLLKDFKIEDSMKKLKKVQIVDSQQVDKQNEGWKSNQLIN